MGRLSDLRLTPGPGGLTIAAIANAHAQAGVTLHGGHVISYQPHGEKPVLWVSTESLYAAGRPIRGGIPICWPWFGPHPTDADKPAHGFARTSLWSVLSDDAIAGPQAPLRLRLTDSEHSRALWPHAFELQLMVTVGRVLDVELLIRNPGPTAFTCTGALHSYFAVSDITNARVHGLDGCAYLDKVLRYQRVDQTGVIDVTAETDRIYLDTTADCLIADAGWQRTIRIGKRGSRTTVVWNPWAERARQLVDFGDDEYREMLCVETANAADDQVTVPPGGEHRLATTISVE